MDKSMEVPQKIKNRTTVQNSTSGLYPKEMKTGYKRDICTPHILAIVNDIAVYLGPAGIHSFFER